MDNLGIKNRINRIIGQLKGVEKMLEEERSCEDVLLQISAIKKAIDSLTKVVVSSSLCKFLPHKEKEKVEKVISRAIDL